MAITQVQQNNGYAAGAASVTVTTIPVTAGNHLIATLNMNNGQTCTSIVDSVSPYGAVVKALAPEAYWRLGDPVGSTTAADSSGNGFTGTVGGTVTFGQAGPIAASIDTAALFDGSTGVVTTTASITTAPWSIALWFNVSASTASTNVMFGTDNPTVSPFDGMRIVQASTNGIRCTVGNGAAATSITSSNPSLNTWHFFCATYNGTTLTGYLDGVSFGSASTAFSVGRFPVTMGRSAVSSANFWAGEMAQVMWFESTLTPTQVSNLYTSSSLAGTNNNWIQCAQNDNLGQDAEIWYARGVQGGTTSVTVTGTGSASIGVNVSEWSGVWYVDPLDSWSQNLGTTAAPKITGLTPREGGELAVVVATSSASISPSPPTGSWTALPGAGFPGFSAAYRVQFSTNAILPTWTGVITGNWATVGAFFVPGAAGINPQLQFPEVLVEISAGANYLSPINGTGVWNNISSYVRGMTLGPLGRQHELDRIQATAAQITVNNRDGSFNPWNTNSFLFNNGNGLDPMSPLKVTAAWNGITYPMYYGYIQSVDQAISDVLNVEAQISCVDILQMLSLKYLSNNNYAQLVAADGGANLQAYYRCGDGIGSFAVKDSSGNNYTGSLIAGIGGDPAFGSQGPFLYDANTALDLTNGTNALNGGFTTVDNSTQPPTVHNPLGSASAWTFETWVKWTSTTDTVIGQTVTFTGSLVGTEPNQITGLNSLAGVAVGQTVTCTTPGVLQSGTYIVAIGYDPALGGFYASLSQAFLATGSYVFEVSGGPIGSTIFSGVTTAGQVDLRVGANTTASVTNYNRLSAGTVLSGGFNPVGYSQNAYTQNGLWHHVALSYAASVATLYVDGSLDSTWATSLWSNPASVSVGCDNAGSNGFPGIMSDVALYSASITPAQAMSHYQTGMWFQSQEFGASVGTSAAGRFNKVAAVAGLPPSTILNVPYQFRTLMYAETNPITTTSALNYLQTQSETEPGLIFQGPNGMIYAYNRQYQYLNPGTTTSQGTFTDTPSTPYYYDGPALVIVADDLDTWNDIQVQSGRSNAVINAGSVGTVAQTAGQLQEWGPTQSALAAQSASVYGSRTMQGLTSLQQAYDSDGLSLAQNYAKWYNRPVQRVVTMGLNSEGNSGNNLPQMLGRGLMDAVTVQYNGQTSSSQFSQTSVIEQITHTVVIDGGMSWQTTWALSPYELTMYPTYLGGWTFGSPASVGVLTL